MTRLAPSLACLSLGLFAGLSGTGCSFFFPSESGGGTPAPRELPKPTGCAATPTHPVAPGGYYINGNTICTEAGTAHLFHGVDRPSLEWTRVGDHLSAADFQLMAGWHANTVRLALNQDFWLSASPIFDAQYARRVDDAIHWAEAAGLDVILDLHWSDGGVLGSCDPSDGCQHLMADKNSVTFWKEIATKYGSDGHVLFELYNEPHDIPWDTWESGGVTPEGWVAAGMQEMYDAIRATGANNIVIAGGLDWAFDLSGVLAHRLSGYNIMYATHPYGGPAQRAPEFFDNRWGFLTATDAVIATEFGDLTGDCSDTYTRSVIEYADKHLASWTAWAWYPGGCKFPALIGDWNGAPSPSGAVVKAALERYAGVTGSKPDGGVGGSDAGGSDASGASDGGAGGDDASPGDGGAGDASGDDAGAGGGDATPARDGSSAGDA